MNKENVVVLKISAPIKLHFTNTKGLDYQTLLGSENYKEQYRKEMILWGEQERKKDYGIFCRTAIEMFNGLFLVIINNSENSVLYEYCKKIVLCIKF